MSKRVRKFEIKHITYEFDLTDYDDLCLTIVINHKYYLCNYTIIYTIYDLDIFKLAVEDKLTIIDTLCDGRAPANFSKKLYDKIINTLINSKEFETVFIEFIELKRIEKKLNVPYEVDLSNNSITVKETD